jgi:serine/threonine protein kinase
MNRIPLPPNNDEKIIPTNSSQCFNPDCLQLNLGKQLLCQYCGEKLLLGERYRSIRYLTAGGFAHTFEAVDEHRLNSRCAIKQFFPRQLNINTQAKAISLFRQEASILKEIGNHPQIPSLLAFLEEEERLYLVEEFIPGKNLQQILNQRGLFTEKQVIQILLKLLPVLQFIHDRSIIHRDIKPSNIIYQENGLLTLIDFGGSLRSTRKYLTQVASIIGTPGYAAPEQMRGKVYPASDLYSLGATVMELLTGFVPQEEEIISYSPQLVAKQVDREISPDLAEILAKLLQPEIRYRYQSAAEVILALEPRFSKREQQISNLEELNLFSQPIDNFLITSDTFLNEEFDYQNLEKLLAGGRYQKADRQTWQLMLQIAQREQQGCLTLEILKKFPVSELDQIDRLWHKYSGGRFGLRVQQEIYQNLAPKKNFNYYEVEGNSTVEQLNVFALWQQFGESVGWYHQGKWLNYSELTFTTDAPRGHLPVYCIDVFNRAGFERGISGWWRLGFITLLRRLEVHLERKNNFSKSK